MTECLPRGALQREGRFIWHFEFVSSVSTGHLKELGERGKGKKFKVPRIIYGALPPSSCSCEKIFLLGLFIPHLVFSLPFLGFLPPGFPPQQLSKALGKPQYIVGPQRPHNNVRTLSHSMGSALKPGCLTFVSALSRGPYEAFGPKNNPVC